VEAVSRHRIGNDSNASAVVLMATLHAAIVEPDTLDELLPTLTVFELDAMREIVSHLSHAVTNEHVRRSWGIHRTINPRSKT
jgi:hypothetical protein